MFGELNFESSHAFADDEEEEVSAESFGLSVEWTQKGEEFLGGSGQGPFVFCGFEGKVALGFGEGFLSNFTLLGQIFVTGNENTVDLCSLRPRKRPAARLFIGPDNSVVFALIDFYGVPRFLANDVVDKMLPLIQRASEVVVFHSEISAYNRSSQDCTGKLFYLKTSQFADKGFEHSLKKGETLKPPNVVGGPCAGILTQCERLGKPGLLLITYAETELVDSISLDPFFQAVSPSSKAAGDCGSKPEAMLALFSKLQHKIRWAADVSNLYA